MSTVNNIQFSKFTAEDLQNHIRLANEGYSLSKSGTNHAVAHCKIIWLGTRSENAAKDQKAMATKAINAENAKIDVHNTAVDLLRSETKKYHADKLDKDHWTKSEPKTDADKKAIAARIAQYEAHRNFTADQWSAMKLMPIDAKASASEFTEIVKWVLGLTSPDHRSIISRYAMVLSWLQTALKDTPIHSVDDIIAVLENAGGFEKALLEQRNVKTGEDQDAKLEKTKREKTIERVKSVVTSAPRKTTIDLEPRFAHGDLVVMLGYSRGGKVDVIAELDTAPDEFNDIISRIDDEDLLPTNDNCELVNRVMHLGELIRVGEILEGSNDDKDSGKPKKSERLMIVKPVGPDKSELIVTARHAKSSIVIHAYPKQPGLLGVPKTASMLAEKAYDRVVRELKVRGQRTYINMDVTVDPVDDAGNAIASPMLWKLTNSALPEESKGWFNKVWFSPVASAEHKPLDVDHFDPQFRFPISRKDLRGIYAHAFNNWAELKAGDKGKRTIKFEIKDTVVTIKNKDHDDYVITLDESVDGRYKMSFNANDFYGLLKSLLGHHIDHFMLTCDEAGLMQVSWDDSLCSYQIYVPTCNEQGKLETRRIAPMRIKSSSLGENIAAE